MKIHFFLRLCLLQSHPHIYEREIMRHYLNSSNIDWIEWKNDNLTVALNNGQVIEYHHINEAYEEGMRTASSPGGYLNRHIANKFSYKIIQEKSTDKEIEKLRHHKDSTVGLWATDKPESIPKDIKHLFFEIDY